MEGDHDESILIDGISLVLSRWPVVQGVINSDRIHHQNRLSSLLRTFFTKPTPLRPVDIHELKLELRRQHDVICDFKWRTWDQDSLQLVAQRLMAVYEACLEGNSYNEIITKVLAQEIFDVDDYEYNDEDYDADDPEFNESFSSSFNIVN